VIGPLLETLTSDPLREDACLRPHWVRPHTWSRSD